MKGFGHAQALKCGITHELPLTFGSLEREKDHISGRGVSSMVNVKMVSGTGSGEVIIALWSWCSTAVRSLEDEVSLCSTSGDRRCLHRAYPWTDSDQQK